MSIKRNLRKIVHFEAERKEKIVIIRKNGLKKVSQNRTKDKARHCHHHKNSFQVIRQFEYLL